MRCSGLATALAALILLCGPPPTAHAALRHLDEARCLEAAGDTAAAARLYLAWAREHAGLPAALSGYAGFLRTERSLDALVDGCRELADKLPRTPGAWPQLAATAQLFEMAGLFEEAAGLAAAAWSRGGPAGLLQRAMRLALVMGDFDAYAAWADRAITVDGLDPLAPSRDLLTGRIDEARRGAERTLSAVADPRARLAAVWTLFAAARAAGGPSDVARAAARIADLFPGSPEAALAAAAASRNGSRVAEAPSPGLLLVPPVEPAGAAPAPPAGGPEPSAGTWSVQAGAFQVRENADELVRDLQRAGFSPMLREAALPGRKLFRVLVASGIDRESAAGLLERLRAAGYSGIVVGD